MEILTAIDTTVDAFILRIIKHFRLKESDKPVLKKLWESKKEVKKEVKKESKKESKKVDLSKLTKASKAELVAECKKHKLKSGGKKSVLLDRLRDYADKKSKNIIKKITTTTPCVIQIRKNKFDNFEHFETGLVFNKKEQKVVGMQEKNGDIRPLTTQDIELCNKYKFSYELPEMLDDVDLEDDIDELDEAEFTVEEYFTDED